MEKQNPKEYYVFTYKKENLHVVIGERYGGEGYSGVTDGVDVTGLLTKVEIQHDSATIWSDKHNCPCAVKLRSLYAMPK